MEGAGSWEWERRPQTEIRILGGYAVLISDDDIAVVSPQPGTLYSGSCICTFHQFPFFVLLNHLNGLACSFFAGFNTVQLWPEKKKQLILLQTEPVPQSKMH